MVLLYLGFTFAFVVMLNDSCCQCSFYAAIPSVRAPLELMGSEMAV